MSRSLNRVALIGNIGGTPDLRTAAGGSRVVTFSLATHRRWTDRSGQSREETDWHRIVAWDPLAGVIGDRLRRGDRVYVEGRIEYRSWDDRSGRRRHLTEILAEEVIFLSGSSEQGGQSHPS